MSNKKVESTDQSRKRKISQKNLEDKPVDESNMEINNKGSKKAKIKKVSPVKKTTEVFVKYGASSGGFIVEETAEKLDKPEHKTISNAKKNLGPSMKKQRNSPTKKVSVTKKVAQAKPSSVHEKKKMNVKKPNAKSSLVKNGGITKKIIKQHKSNTPSLASSKKPVISDERLRAFGLNPKKFHKKLKYGNKSTASGTATNSKNVVTENSKHEKLKQKKIKKKLLKVLES